MKPATTLTVLSNASVSTVTDCVMCQAQSLPAKSTTETAAIKRWIRIADKAQI